jgi:ABC-type lipoprotein release transport system permease subunit
MVAAIFPDQLYMEWMGDPLTYLLVSATVASIVSLIAWEGQAGLGGVVLGTVLGIPLAIGLSLVAAFIIWVLGYQFPGNEEIFMTIAYSLPMGFKMGLSGSITGALLSRFYLPKS